MTRSTGFAEGLYDESESNASAIKGKELKVAYLNKVCTCVRRSQCKHESACVCDREQQSGSAMYAISRVPVG